MVINRIIPRKEADPTAPMNDTFEKQKKEEQKIVQGVFQDHELKGGSLHFFYKKWKGDKVQEYKLEDGKEYELPLGVVRHLNSDCATEEHSYLLGTDGKHIKTGRKIHRFSFKSNEYL